MGLWSAGMKRIEKNEKRIEELIDEINSILEGQSRITRFSIFDSDKGIVDIEGSVEIHQRDLDNGELPFKIRKLTGDIILVGEGVYKKSVLPDELGGNIVIKL